MSLQFNENIEGKFDYHDEWYSPVENINDIDDLAEAIKMRNLLVQCENEYEPESGHPCFWMLRQQEDVIKEYMRKVSDFDKTVLLNNINMLLKEHNMKIGELEQLLGISAGYISRIAKYGSDKKFSVDVAWKIAHLFNHSLYELLEVNYSELTPTEKYLVSFIEKLCSDTIDDKIDWNLESADSLNNAEMDMNGNVLHPLLNLETFYEEGETEYPNQVTRVVLISRTFGYQTSFNGDCFNLKMKNGSIFYVVNISKSVYKVGDKNAFAKEIWMYQPGIGTNFLCSNKEPGALSNLVERLYAIVSERMQHPQIRRELQDVIDAYMNDEIIINKEIDLY